MTERQTKILEIVNQGQRVEVNRLSEMLAVSQVTIRKDLDGLEARGLLVREHGYAVVKHAGDLNNRLAVRYDVKLGIAKEAAKLVSNGETVMMESGSCCALLAEQLARHKKDVTIITNSAFVAGYVREVDSGKVVLLGGEYLRESQVMVGPLVRICAREFYVDKLFLGTDGFIPEAGFTCGDLMRAEAMKSMAESARHTVILTDSSKFSHQGVVLQSRLEAVAMVYTDRGLGEEAKAILEKHHISLVAAG